MKNYIVSLILIMASILCGFSQVSNSDLIKDIEQLRLLVETKHVWPYRLVTKENFEAQVHLAKATIEAKKECDETCYVEILKIIAKLNDGHSVTKYGTREKLFGYLPITVTWFKEGLYVTRVSQKHQNILGAKLEAINDVDIEVVLTKLREVIPHGNNSRFKKFAYSYLRMPGLLYGLGITDNPLESCFKLSLDSNSSFNIVLKHMDNQVFKKTKFVDYNDINPNIPLFGQRNSEFYWYHYDAENRIFYFKYNRIGNMENQRASDFAARMWAKVDSLDIDKFVIDIRNNGGGQFAYSMSFIQGILDRPKINTLGNLFAISGYDTFSAALDMLRNLEVRSNVIILGETPGDYAASSGDPNEFILDNSKIKLQLSSVFHPTIFKQDKRNGIILDKVIESSWDNYRQGKDAIYNYIANYKEPVSNTISAESYGKYLGTFTYDEDKNIEIKSIDNSLFMEISKSLISPLYLIKGTSFRTEIQGMTVRLNKRHIVVNFPDGEIEKFKKIKKGKSGLDYLYVGNFKDAKPIYINIKKENPDSPLIRDSRFSNLALFAFFELRKTNKELASTVAKGILNLGIELNDGKAPFCEFALRFY